MLIRSSRCTINPPLTIITSVPLHDGFDSDFELNLRCDEQSSTPFPEDIFDDIKFLVRIKGELDHIPDEEVQRKDCIYKTFLSQALSRAYASLSASHVANVVHSEVKRCIQLSKILFLYTICPSMSVSGVYSQSVATALRARLVARSRESECPVRWSSEILCWILVNGAITKQPKASRAWYLRRVEDFRRSRNIQTLDQLIAMLRKIIWVEDKFGSACRRIWLEDLGAQSSDGR